MAEAYLQQRFAELQCPKDLAHALAQLQTSSQQRILNVFREGPRQPQRKRLRQKPEPPPAPKPTVLDKQTRDQLNREFLEKTRLTQQMTKRLKQEQEAIQLRTSLRQQRTVDRLQDYWQEQEREAACAQEIKAQMMKRSLTEKRERRLKQREAVIHTIRRGHSNYKSLLETVPLYKRMEDGFFKKKERSQLEVRKQELARKRNFLVYAPSQSSELKLSTSQGYPKSRFFYIQQTQRALEQQAAEEAELQRKTRQEKQQQYSRLVREVFQPVPSPAKQRELSEKIHKLHNSRPLFVPNNRPLNLTTLKRPPRLETSPKSVKVDYLKEVKTQTAPAVEWEDVAQSSLAAEVKAHKLRKLAGAIESKALRAEAQLDGVSLTNAKTLQTSEEVSKLLINSIKAKLAILDEPNTSS